MKHYNSEILNQYGYVSPEGKRVLRQVAKENARDLPEVAIGTECRAGWRNENGERYVLRSYVTDVCYLVGAFMPGGNGRTWQIVRTWDRWSATTAKHVNEFLAAFRLPALGKREWLALPVGVPVEIGGPVC